MKASPSAACARGTGRDGLGKKCDITDASNMIDLQ